MEIEKAKRKIKKLLALSGSDNKHEAERAAEQAKKLMARFSLASEDCQIVRKETAEFRGKKAPIGLAGVAVAITEIAPVCVSSNTRTEYDKQTWIAKNFYSFTFTGLELHVDLAIYSFEVLHKQYVDELKAIKAIYKEKGQRFTQKHERIFGLAWVSQVGSKIKAIFPKPSVSDRIVKVHKDSLNGKGIKYRDVIYDDRKSDEADALSIGYEAGERVRLHQATESKTDRPILIDR